jgi:hypothetical protein
MSAEPERQELRYRRLGGGYHREDAAYHARDAWLEATIRRAEEILARAVAE